MRNPGEEDKKEPEPTPVREVPMDGTDVDAENDYYYDDEEEEKDAKKQS